MAVLIKGIHITLFISIINIIYIEGKTLCINVLRQKPTCMKELANSAPEFIPTFLLWQDTTGWWQFMDSGQAKGRTQACTSVAELEPLCVVSSPLALSIICMVTKTRPSDLAWLLPALKIPSCMTSIRQYISSSQSKIRRKIVYITLQPSTIFNWLQGSKIWEKNIHTLSEEFTILMKNVKGAIWSFSHIVWYSFFPGTLKYNSKLNYMPLLFATENI